MKYIIESDSGSYYKGDLAGARQFARRLEDSGVEYTVTYGGRPIEITAAEPVPYDAQAAKDRARRRLAGRIGWY